MARDLVWWLETSVIFIAAGSALISFISLLVMFFYSIWRIEREMKRDGLPRPCAWDFTGYRAIPYWTYLTKSRQKLAKAAEKGGADVYGLDPGHLVRYVRPVDRFIARLAIISVIPFAVFGCAMLLYQRYFMAG